MRTFLIENEVISVDPSWGLNDKINSRTTASFTVIDKGNLNGIDTGDEVKIYQYDNLPYTDDNLIFAGTVESVDESEDIPGELFYDVKVVDFNSLADKRVVADAFENTLAGDIVRSIITNILSAEGVTEGNIADGVEIKKAVFPYDKATTSLDYIKDVTGLNWNINFLKQLDLFDRSTNIAPFVLDDTVQHSNFKKTKTRSQYRNRQYIRAGQGKTVEQTLEKPSPKPDGASRNFIVRFPVAEKPRIFINSVEVNANYIGVNGLDKNMKFYFSYNSNVISHDDSETVLSATDVIEITYIGLFPILVMVDDANQITERRTKEPGTSGVYEKLVKETSINEKEQALQYGQGLIDKYANIPETVSFNTEVKGLKAGQLLTINKPLYGLDSSQSFLIESVNISPSSNNLNYSIKALDGSALGGWEEFFKELLKGNREYVIQENEVLILMNYHSEKTGWGSETNIKVFDALLPSDNLYPSDTLYPGTLNTEVNVDG